MYSRFDDENPTTDEFSPNPPMDDEELWDDEWDDVDDYYEPADVLYDERDDIGPFYDPQDGDYL